MRTKTGGLSTWVVFFVAGATAMAATGDENWDAQFGTNAAVRGGSIYAVAVSGSNVYVGGSFTNIGGVTANHVARWDGTSWSALGVGGVNGPVYSLAVTGGMVYAGGRFTSATYFQPGVPLSHWVIVAATNIAVYSPGLALFNIPASWSAVGDGFDDQVNALAVGANGIYAGGAFLQSGANAMGSIARWDGSQWNALAKGVDGAVASLAASGSNVFAGGWFSNTLQRVFILVPGGGGIWITKASPCAHIAQWNGSAWHTLSNGVDQTVDALAVSGSDLYAGGWFTNASGVAANHMARWDGSSWHAMDSGVSGTVYGLAVSGSNVYATGTFDLSYQWVRGVPPIIAHWASFTVNHIAQWDGTGWCAMGSGLNDGGKAIAAVDDDVYVGGYFTKAGGKPSNALAHWRPAPLGPWSGASDVGSGWKWLDWFGYFNPSAEPWIYHLQHGWLYVYGTDTSSLCFWDQTKQAWWWTSADTYPYLYRFSDSSWLWYQMDSTNPRHMYNLTASVWETW